jgi:hypothetical protein
MLRTIDKKVGIKDVVAKQLPEFVRENYPTFVAFVEAYYEFLQNNEVRLDQVRDVDLTLDKFVQYFKSELANSLPASVQNERFVLSHIRDEYLAKGSEASYRLLFRLLYGKEINMEYPGRSMLRVSDGRWKQDISLFVRVDAGNPNEIVGKTVDIQTSRRIFRTEVNPLTQKLTKITANVESAVLISDEDSIWEIFLDRNFYGTITAGDVLKLGSSFQAQILPTTSRLRIQNRGQGFRPGQVFQVSSGEGTPVWFKVTSVDDVGGLLTIDIIKFALGYDTDFSITILPTSAVTTNKKIERQVSTITYSKVLDTIGDVTILSSGTGYTIAPQVIIGGTGTGATAHAVLGSGATAGQVVDIIIDTQGSGYTTAFANIINAVGDTTGFGATAEVITGDSYAYNTNDPTKGFSELGYINYGDYWASAYSDGAYVGTVARQFFVDARDTIAGNPALINVSLDALAKYPGYYRSNDGFLNDAMFIQDSYYYQAFSYVVRIDEQLASYAAVVRSLLHPSGMALFGEYSINNKIDLSIALEVMIKSLGITVYDEFFPIDLTSIILYKDISDAFEVPGGGSAVIDQIASINVDKPLADSINTPGDLSNWTFTKGRTETVLSTDSLTPIDTTKRLDDIPVLTDVMTRSMSNFLADNYANLSETYEYSIDKPLADTQLISESITGKDFSKIVTDTNIVLPVDTATLEAGKLLEDTYTTSSITESLVTSVSKSLTDAPVTSDALVQDVTKYVTDTTVGTFTESGYVTKNPYDEGGYFLEIYATPYESTF